MNEKLTKVALVLELPIDVVESVTRLANEQNTTMKVQMVELLTRLGINRLVKVARSGQLTIIDLTKTTRLREGVKERRCPGCKEWLELNIHNWHSVAADKGGKCVRCYAIYQRAHYYASRGRDVPLKGVKRVREVKQVIKCVKCEAVYNPLTEMFVGDQCGKCWWEGKESRRKRA